MQQLIDRQSGKLKDTLEKVVANLSKGFSGEIKVSVYDVSTGINAQVNGNKSGWAASIIKVPVMVAAIDQIEQGKLSLEEQLQVNHKFTLETYDYASKQPQGSFIPVYKLIHTMIVNSDNEATNMLLNKMGVPEFNQFIWSLGMDNTMLGHLLCSNVDRYCSDINEDGSNITCTDDMVKILRHIYDPKFSKISAFSRGLSDLFMTPTNSANFKHAGFALSNVKAKIGLIHDPIDGTDIHEVGIVDDRIIIAIMMNKVGQSPYLKNKANATNVKPTSEAYPQGFLAKQQDFNFFQTALSQPYFEDLGDLSDAYNLGSIVSVSSKYNKIVEAIATSFGYKSPTLLSKLKPLLPRVNAPPVSVILPYKDKKSAETKS